MFQSSGYNTLSSYMQMLKMRSKSTQKLFKCTMNNIEKFGMININNLSQYDEDEIYGLLQEWIVWNNERGITASSLMVYFNAFRAYLWYNKIKLDQQDISQNLRFPHVLHEYQHPLTTEMIQKIIYVSTSEFRLQLLALISSGMRVGELGQIKLTYLDLTHSNIMVRIPAQITKTGRSRITFFSKQVSNMIRYKIRNNKLDDYVFCGNRTKEQSTNLILKRFSVARKKCGFMDAYEHCKQNRYKIHVHSMRSYFITKTNKVQFGLGHILAGHNFYMKEYNQYTIDELLDMYKKAEKYLTFYRT